MPAPWFTSSSDPALESGEIVLAAHPAAAPHARQFTRSVLAKWGLEELTDVCALIVTELTANAVDAIAAIGGLTEPASSPMAATSCGDTVAVKLVRTQRYLVVEVWDSSHDVPVPSQPDDTAERGRGLMLVDALTAGWNYYPSPDGTAKAVWASIPLSAQG